MVIGFEPDLRSWKELQTASNESYRVLNTALYREPAELELFLTRKPGKSSIYRPNRQLVDEFPDSVRFDILDTATVRADTLDSQLKANGIYDVDFIKLDTQGSELPILEGAQSVLETTFGVEAEVHLAPIYHALPLFFELDAFLRSKGFSLFDFRPVYWKRAGGGKLRHPKGQLIHGDALYFKALKPFIRGLGPESADRKAKVFQAVQVCMAYRLLDYALALVDALPDFDRSERLLLERLVKRAQRRADTIPGGRFLRKATARLAKSLGADYDVRGSWRTVGSGSTLGS